MTLLCLYGVAFIFFGFSFYYLLKGIIIHSKDYLKASGIKFIKAIVLCVLAFFLDLFYRVGAKINAGEGKTIINLSLVDNILFGLIIALAIWIIVKGKKKKRN